VACKPLRKKSKKGGGGSRAEVREKEHAAQGRAGPKVPHLRSGKRKSQGGPCFSSGRTKDIGGGESLKKQNGGGEIRVACNRKKKENKSSGGVRTVQKKRGRKKDTSGCSPECGHLRN